MINMMPYQKHVNVCLNILIGELDDDRICQNLCLVYV